MPADRTRTAQRLRRMPSEARKRPQRAARPGRGSPHPCTHDRRPPRRTPGLATGSRPPHPSMARGDCRVSSRFPFKRRVCGHRFTKPRDGLVQVAFDRALWTTQHRGRLLCRKTDDPTEGNHLTLPVRKLGHDVVNSPGQFGPPRHWARVAIGRLGFGIPPNDRKRAPPSDFATDSYGESPDPRPPGGLRAFSLAGRPGPHQGLLSGLRSIGFVPQQCEAEPKRPRREFSKIRLQLAALWAQHPILASSG